MGRNRNSFESVKENAQFTGQLELQQAEEPIVKSAAASFPENAENSMNEENVDLLSQSEDTANEEDVIRNDNTISDPIDEKNDKHLEAVRLTREKVEIHEMINFDKEPETPVKVSIVVPVCNVEKYLRECIDSCVNQTLRDIEIICVNDGSTDSCPDILREYADKDERVKVVNKDNAGYGHTMNLGMDLARGEYIGIVESDDFVVPEMYEELYSIAKSNCVDFVKADFYRFFENDGQYEMKYVKTARNDYMYDKIIYSSDEKHYLESFRSIMNTWSGIYKSNFIKDNDIRHNETAGASFQDNGFYFKTFCNARKLYFHKKAYYHYRIDNPNSSSNNKGKVDAAKTEFRLIKEYITDNNWGQFYIDMFYWKKYNSYMYNYLRIAEQYKIEYLKAISQEYKEELETNKINSDIFFSYEIDEIEWIANDPIDYYEQHSQNSVKVSVIIPVYNSSEYLTQCLDSIINQTLREIEIICIDDGSEDISLDILRDYERNDERVKVITQTNLGAGAARNNGMAIARGEYLSFLDSDDFFDLDMLKEVYEKCRATHSDIGVFKVKNYDTNTHEVTSDKGSFVEQNIPKTPIFYPQSLDTKIFSTFQTWAWNKLFRRHFVEKEKLLFQEIYRTNDMLFVNSALIKAKRIAAIPKEYAYYRRNSMVNCQATNHLYPTDFFKALLALQDVVLKMEYEPFIISFKNLVVKSCIYNLNSQKEAGSFAALYNFLHSDGFQTNSIDLMAFDESDIEKTNRINYHECLNIVNFSFDEYMFGKLIYYRNNRKKNENDIASLNTKLKKQSDELKKNEHKINVRFTDVPVLKDTIKVEFTSCKDEIKKMNVELKKAYSESKQYLEEVYSIRASFSYKLGRFITWLPRKIRGMFNKNN